LSGDGGADLSTSAATPVATAQNSLRGYAGGVALLGAGEARTTQTILCETNDVVANVAVATPGTANNDTEIVCGTNMSEVTK
jgi:type IV pilus assembly protein PilA